MERHEYLSGEGDYDKQHAQAASSIQRGSKLWTPLGLFSSLFPNVSSFLYCYFLFPQRPTNKPFMYLSHIFTC